MNGSESVETLSEAESTALGRLGSDKYLIAATDANLETDAVLKSVAASAASGRKTFEAWAETETGPAAETFTAAAETEGDNFQRVTEAFNDADAGPELAGNAVHTALQSVDGTVERAGAMVRRGLVGDRTRLQVVNFFVNEGDEQRANLARDLRAAANVQVEAGAELLTELCESDGDWEHARDGATAVITAAYEDYAGTLEGMGVDPKPVC